MLSGYYFFLLGTLGGFFALVAIVTIAIAVVVRTDEHRPIFSPGELIFGLGWLLFFASLLAIMIVAIPGSGASADSPVYGVALVLALVGATIMVGHLAYLTIRWRRQAARRDYQLRRNTLAENLFIIGAPTFVGGSLIAGKTSGYMMWLMYALALLGALLMLAAFIIERRKRARSRVMKESAWRASRRGRAERSQGDGWAGWAGAEAFSQ